ncbi:hypothetical protein RRG08_064561 [Elysia crispata]|uniref:Transposase n=1 Tax=Elysia crispata TaxID=231223 RepID=A0AAE1B9C4_9GAST|nr:hypothetical protein RRG08_064561 [Elysia crispata]
MLGEGAFNCVFRIVLKQTKRTSRAVEGKLIIIGRWVIVESAPFSAAHGEKSSDITFSYTGHINSACAQPRQTCKQLGDPGSSRLSRGLPRGLPLQRLPVEGATFTSSTLTTKFKSYRTNFLRRFQTEQNDFLGRIITGDETWVYSWDPETKRQSAEWVDFDEPRPEKLRRKQGALKYYKKVLQDKLRPAIRKKRPGLLESGILFHHDNAPVHTARAVTDVLAGYKWELLEHPRYSPDLAPCDFHLFPKMKEHLRGQRFETEEDIIQATKVAIKNLDKCSYVTAFKDWLQRIEKCANNGGCYVE